MCLKSVFDCRNTVAHPAHIITTLSRLRHNGLRDDSLLLEASCDHHDWHLPCPCMMRLLYTIFIEVLGETPGLKSQLILAMSKGCRLSEFHVCPNFARCVPISRIEFEGFTGLVT